MWQYYPDFTNTNIQFSFHNKNNDIPKELLPIVESSFLYQRDLSDQDKSRIKSLISFPKINYFFVDGKKACKYFDAYKISTIGAHSRNCPTRTELCEPSAWMHQSIDRSIDQSIDQI